MKNLNNIIKSLLPAIVSVICQCAYSQITVVDANDKLPVISASIYNGNGTDVIGITDYDGKLPKTAEQLQSIHIQHINYMPANINLQSLKDSTILLTPRTHKLPEVKISKQKDAMLRMKVYIRHMTVLNSKPAAVSESMAYLYFKENNDDGKPNSYKILSEDKFKDEKAYEGESKMLKSLADFSNPTALAFFDGYKHYNTLKGSRRMGTSWKRAGGIYYMNEDSINKRCEIVRDSLFSDKPFKVPLFGFAFSNIYNSETYSTELGTPRLYNLINMTDRYRVYQTKTMGYVDMVTEMYILDIDYASKEEMKADKKLKLSPFERPEGIVAADDWLTTIIKGMKRIK